VTDEVARHHFAFFRLLALALPRPASDGRALRPLDRDQSAFESYSLALIVWLTAACYVYAAIPNAIGAIIALPVVPILLQLPMFATRLILPSGQAHHDANARLVLTILLAASAYFALSHSWARFPAWCFIALFPINAIAAVVMRFAGRR
jgi:hypothetical protein